MEKKDIIPIHTEDIALFSIQPTNAAVDHIYWVKKGPTYLNDEGNNAVHFNIPGDGTDYTDLYNTYLYVKLKIVDEDGNVFKQGDALEENFAIPVDNIMHSLWDHVDVKLNNSMVSFSTNNYMYKALFENLLFYDKNARLYQTSSFGFFGESGNFSNPNPLLTPYNRGLNDRYELWKGVVEVQDARSDDPSKLKDPSMVEFCGPLLADICNQRKYILNLVDIDILLQPKNDEFRLMTSPKGTMAKIKIQEIYLNVCKVDVAPEARLGIERGLKESKIFAQYPFQRTDIRTYNIPQGSFGETIEDLYQGHVPSKIIVGLVDSSAFSGNYSKNPFHFQHFDISKIGFYVNNVSTPEQPLTVNIKESDYLMGFLSLYKVAGKLNENTDIGINRDSYRQGYTLFGFNVDPTASYDMSYLGKTKTGITKLDINFRRGLPINITVVVYAVFPEVMEIDFERVVRLQTKNNRIYA